MASDINKRTGAMYSKVHGASLTEVEQAMMEMAFSAKETYSVVKAISEPIVSLMQQNAPVNEGRVKRSIRIFRSRKDPHRRVQIGPKYIKGGGPDAGNAAHFTEFGTDQREMKEGLRFGVTRQLEKFKGPPQFTPYKGKKLGRVQSKEWIYQTYIQTKSKTENEAEVLIHNLIDEKAKRNGLKTK